MADIVHMDIHIHHFAIAVQNINESVQWYKHIFDFSLVQRYEANGMQIALCQRGQCRLELFHMAKKCAPCQSIART